MHGADLRTEGGADAVAAAGKRGNERGDHRQRGERGTAPRSALHIPRFVLPHVVHSWSGTGWTSWSETLTRPGSRGGGSYSTAGASSTVSGRATAAGFMMPAACSGPSFSSVSRARP